MRVHSTWTLTRLAVPIAIAGVVGCNLLSGAGDFEVGPVAWNLSKDSGATRVTPDAAAPPQAFFEDAGPYDAGQSGYTDLTGSWTGSWIQDLTIVGGATTMEVTQNGGSLAATLEIQGGVCPKVGTLKGEFVAPNKTASTFTSDDGTLVLKLESTISADATTLNGRFLSIGACLPGAFGTTKSTRTSTPPK